jgi:hypothetical protein
MQRGSLRSVVLAHLIGQQQSLVDDRACRHRRLVELLAVLQSQRLNGIGSATADDVQLALQGVGNHDVRTTPNEDLPDHRFARPYRRRHRQGMVDRHVAPAQHDLALGAHSTLDLFLTGKTRSGFFRQEDHPDTVVARLRQQNALFGHFLTEESVGNLDQDAGTVAHQRVRTDGTPVIQVLQDQQALLDDRETLRTPDVRYKTDAACVVLVGRVVKPLPFRYSRIHHARILIKPRRLPGDRWSATPQKPGTTAAGRSLRGTRDYTPNAPAVQDAAPHQAGAPDTFSSTERRQRKLRHASTLPIPQVS